MIDKLSANALSIIIISTLVLGVAAELFPLSIVHINDFHARYEPTDETGGYCDESELCIGGYARIVYMVRRLLKEQADKNVIYFNAGDSFQGTLWYNIGRWNVTQQFLNFLPADAMTLGNHEFDHGIDGLVPFLETINTTMLVANMDSRDEPTMQNKYKNSMIIERSGRKIGVIGIILETTNELSNTGKIIFKNESETIREESAKLREQGANIIIAITHCGYEVDKIIAKNVGADVDVIVGAHSHTFLYTGENSPGPDKPRGDYPTEIIHENGHRVLIVQAAAYGRYVGNLTVYFDDNGDVVDFEGKPIYLSADIPQDDEINQALIPWKEIVAEKGNVVVGQTKVTLSADCDAGECSLGNFYTDAMVYAFVGLSSYNSTAWSKVSIGLINDGGLRVSLYPGKLTYSHLITMSPFENQLIAFNLPGKRLVEALEFSVMKIDLTNNVTSSDIFLQLSGLKVIYNLTLPAGERVVDVQVRCSYCEIPKYETLNHQTLYRIVAPSFIAKGGVGYYMFPQYGTDVQIEMIDLDAIVKYTEVKSPIYQGLRGHIQLIT